MNRVITGVTASWDGYELELSLSESGLGALMEIFDSTVHCSFRVEAGNGAGDVSLFEINRSDGKIMLRVAAGVARFSGGDSAFKSLVENMRVLKNAWKSGGTGHMHFDPVSDDLLLDGESDAFILSGSG